MYKRLCVRLLNAIEQARNREDGERDEGYTNGLIEALSIVMEVIPYEKED